MTTRNITRFIIIYALIMLLCGCDGMAALFHGAKPESPSVAPPEGATVTLVSVSPPTASVAKGGTVTFTATVLGTGSPAQTVTWSVEGGGSAGTIVSASGVLAVAADEGASSLTVRATSTVDASKSGTAPIAVSAVSATVTSVSVNPPTANVAKGSTAAFNAIVLGTNSPAQSVTWFVSGGSAGTAISAGGVLAVAADESATGLIVMATSTMDTTKSGTAAVTVSAESATVSSVSVSPPSTSLAKGSTAAFNAIVLGTNSPAQSVTWTVEGGSSGTNISVSGVLSVAAGEVASALTVRARSTVDATKSGTAAVTVNAVSATVSSVSVSPPSTSLAKGSTAAFNAIVLGTNSPAQSVTWTVEGGSSGTNISVSGVLSVAAGEVASALTVRARSTVDATKSGTAAVTVTDPGSNNPTVSVVSVDPSSISVLKGGTQTFSATVSGTNSPAQSVSWSVEGGGAGTSISAGGILAVAADEGAESLTVRATSTVDATKNGTASVSVTSLVPTVTLVSVNPPTASVAKGGTAAFSATVTGTNNPAQTVTWTVEHGGAGTAIGADGVLAVAAGEAASALTVRATSTVDATKNGTASVAVTPPLPTTGTLAERLAWLSSYAVNGGDYTLELNASEAIAPTTLSYGGKTVKVTLVGAAAERTVSLSSVGSLFTVSSGVTLTLDANVTLQGRSDNTASLVSVNSGATLAMKGNAKITGNTASAPAAYGGGVYVYGSGATFTMSGNAAVSGNTAATSSASGGSASGGGVYVYGNGATFTMSGNAAVSGNTASAPGSWSPTASGGGVRVGYGGSFTMSDNTAVSGNTASSSYHSYGGGVDVGGSFTKTGGVIYGTSESANSNTASTGGAAVYVDDTHRRNTTVTAEQNMSRTSAGVYTGAWTD